MSRKVCIIQPGGLFDGAVLPAWEVLRDPWLVNGFTNEELAAGEGQNEWLPGTMCRDLKSGLLYEYVDGLTWACVWRSEDER